MRLLCTLCLLALISCQSKTQNSESITAIDLPVFQPDQITKANRSPLYFTEDMGRTWQDARSKLPAHMQVTFLVPIGDEMLIATDNVGLWKSSKQLTEWKDIGMNLPGRKINAVLVDGDFIYVGVYRKGVYRSDDLGTSWQELNEGISDLKVQALFTFAGNIYVGTDSGIDQLDVSKNQWLTLFKGPQILNIEGMEDKMIAGTSQGTLLSKDQGSTWNWIHREGAVHYTRLIDGVIIELQINGALHYSENWGESWQRMEYGPTGGSYVYEVSKGPQGDWMMSNNYGIHYTTDLSSAWQLIFPTENAAFFDFLQVGDRIYGGTRAWDEYRGR